MIHVLRILIAIVVVEVVVFGTLLALETTRTVPQLPDVELNDPLVMPQLRSLARKAESGDSDDWRRLGEALVGKGFYAHAEQAFRESLRQDPQNFPAQFGLAFSLDRSGRIKESSAEYRKLLRLPASSAEEQMNKFHAQYALGRNALRQENTAEAESLFRQNAGYPPADYQVAKLLIRSGRAEKALPIIESNLVNTPFSLEFHHLDYRANLALDQPRAAFEAATMVERSAYLVSMNFNTEYIAPLDTYTGIAPRLRALGKAVEEEDLRQVEQIGTEIKSRLKGSRVFTERLVDEQLLNVAIRSERPERALELVEEMRKTGREDAITLEHEGDARNMLGEPEKAGELWQRALKLSPSVRLHRKLANYFETRNVTERDRQLGRAALLSGIAEYRSNRLQEAIPPLREAARLNPQDPDPWYYIGEMYFHLGRFEDAQTAYQKCLDLRPGHGRAAAKIEHLAGRHSSS